MRVKTTKELQNSYYPEHMIWIPLQDYKGVLKELEDKWQDRFDDLDENIGSCEYVEGQCMEIANCLQDLRKQLEQALK